MQLLLLMTGNSSAEFRQAFSWKENFRHFLFIFLPFFFPRRKLTAELFLFSRSKGSLGAPAGGAGFLAFWRSGVERFLTLQLRGSPFFVFHVWPKLVIYNRLRTTDGNPCSPTSRKPITVRNSPSPFPKPGALALSVSRNVSNFFPNPFLH